MNCFTCYLLETECLDKQNCEKMYPAYYIICKNSYEIDGKEFYRGQIQWKPKECRPILNADWRKAIDSEVDEWLKNKNEFDMRTIQPSIK